MYVWLSPIFCLHCVNNTLAKLKRGYFSSWITNSPRTVMCFLFISLHSAGGRATKVVTSWPLRAAAACWGSLSSEMHKMLQKNQRALYLISNESTTHCWCNPVNTSETNQFGITLREKQKRSATDKLWTKKKNSLFLSPLFSLIFQRWNRKSGQWESCETDRPCGGAYGPGRVWWKGSNEA